MALLCGTNHWAWLTCMAGSSGGFVGEHITFPVAYSLFLSNSPNNLICLLSSGMFLIYLLYLFTVFIPHICSLCGPKVLTLFFSPPFFSPHSNSMREVRLKVYDRPQITPELLQEDGDLNLDLSDLILKL